MKLLRKIIVLFGSEFLPVKIMLGSSENQITISKYVNEINLSRSIFRWNGLLWKLRYFKSSENIIENCVNYKMCKNNKLYVNNN